MVSSRFSRKKRRGGSLDKRIVGDRVRTHCLASSQSGQTADQINGRQVHARVGEKVSEYVMSTAPASAAARSMTADMSGGPLPAVADAIIQVKRVGHTVRSKGRRVQALAETDLDIKDREFLTIVGPSGCGKSTLMNLIVGLFAPSSGEILYRGKRITGVNRAIGYVTQADNLYPWRTLRHNVEFPLELRGVGAKERRERATRLIHRVGLSGFEDSYPHELSGGMRQRANIIRTLVYEPEVILMDEPFGPLDAQTRLILQNQLLDLWQEERKTVIFITHDLGEAVALADRVVVMSARPGRIKTVATVPIPRPRDLFEIHADERFRETYNMLWSSLEEEVKKVAQ
jgi:NitT/TauT family transport system ATP-binding protein